MEDCIFCKIIDGEIPSNKVYEDDTLLAILDITQTTKGHTLVIPKKHHRNLLEMPSQEVGLLFSKIPHIANLLKDKLDAKGMNILQNNEEIAGQSVFHTHIHLIPRYDSSDGFDIHFTENEQNFDALIDKILD
ncbi:MAG: HIT family protein [Streptococcaceae bacterium]|nr:HIT family protein [Streptococcaceae bacterium]